MRVASGKQKATRTAELDSVGRSSAAEGAMGVRSWRVAPSGVARKTASKVSEAVRPAAEVEMVQGRVVSCESVSAVTVVLRRSQWAGMVAMRRSMRVPRPERRVVKIVVSCECVRCELRGLEGGD